MADIPKKFSLHIEHDRGVSVLEIKPKVFLSSSKDFEILLEGKIIKNTLIPNVEEQARLNEANKAYLEYESAQYKPADKCPACGEKVESDHKSEWCTSEKCDYQFYHCYL